MCLFQSGANVPPFVLLSLRTLQYLVIPLLSSAIFIVGLTHLGQCQAQPLLPLWHIIAGTSGMLTPILYLTFDKVAPRLSTNFATLSEVLDNLVVCLLPIYIVFELGWLVTGTVWVFGSSEVDNPKECSHPLFVFSAVVLANFWLHVLTPMVFMLCLCCARLIPCCAKAKWDVLKTTVTNSWSRGARLTLASVIALPLGIAMISIGAYNLAVCYSDGIEFVPVWLCASGGATLIFPAIYFAYDAYCKSDAGERVAKRTAHVGIIIYILCGLIWALLGFSWIFSEVPLEQQCTKQRFSYSAAVFGLLAINLAMDFWICFKIVVVLYWAFLSED